MSVFVEELFSQLASCVSVSRVSPWWVSQIQLYYVLLLPTLCDSCLLLWLLINKLERAMLCISLLGDECLLRGVLQSGRSQCCQIFISQSDWSILDVLRLMLIKRRLGSKIVNIVFRLSKLPQRHVLLQYLRGRIIFLGAINRSELPQRHVLLQHLRVIDSLNHRLYPMVWCLLRFWCSEGVAIVSVHI